MSAKVLQQSPYEKILSMLSRGSKITQMTFNEVDFPPEALRATLKTIQIFLTKVTLQGTWPDRDIKTFTAYLKNVKSLTFCGSRFSDTAFDEAFCSRTLPVSILDDDLYDYVESQNPAPVDDDEWDEIPVKPFVAPTIPPPPSNSEVLLKGEPWMEEAEEAARQSSPIQEHFFCPNLEELVIEDAPLLTSSIFKKLLPIAHQLKSLRLNNCPGVESSHLEEFLSKAVNIKHLEINGSIFP